MLIAGFDEITKVGTTGRGNEFCGYLGLGFEVIFIEDGFGFSVDCFKL